MRKYRYRGIPTEKVPGNVTHVTMNDHVYIVHSNAFKNCWALQSIIMNDEVVTIEPNAFHSCVSLKFVRLSRRLRSIGKQAFAHCWSLEALFLPPTMEKIGDHAFLNCTPLRIIRLPVGTMNMKAHSEVTVGVGVGIGVEVPVPVAVNYGKGIIVDCDRMLAVSDVQYEFEGENHYHLPTTSSNNDVNEWLCQRHQNRPMHALCHHIGMIGINKYSNADYDDYDIVEFDGDIRNKIDESVSTSTSTLNIHSTSSACEGRGQITSFSNGTKEIIELSQTLHGNEAYSHDEFGMTPLHILTANPHAPVDAILACHHAYPNAVFVMDDSRLSPLDYARSYNVNGLLALIRVLLVGG